VNPPLAGSSLPVARARVGLSSSALALLLMAGCSSAGPAEPARFPGSNGWSVVRSADAEALLEDPALQVVDTRFPGLFDAGHLPGAVRVDPDALRAEIDDIDGQVVARADAEAVFESAGLDARRPMLVVGDDNDPRAARVLWTLAHFGAEADLYLLDGGMRRWTGSVEVGPSEPLPSVWSGGETRGAVRVDLPWMREHVDDPAVAVFDVRTSAEYEAGHLPGAPNVFWESVLAEDGRFLDPQAIVAHHPGAADAETVVVMCDSGFRASVSWAVLNAAGLSDVRLYDGSWNEWGSDPSTPKSR
jgi:thiosulfate/3-mercaptopyruvate sulfurtransferase